MKKELSKRNKYIGTRRADKSLEKFKEEGGSILELFRRKLKIDTDNDGYIKFTGMMTDIYDIQCLKILEKYFSPLDFIGLICQIDDLTDLALKAREKGFLSFRIISPKFKTHNGTLWCVHNYTGANKISCSIFAEVPFIIEASLDEFNFFYFLRNYLTLSDDFKEKNIRSLIREFDRIKYEITVLEDN